MLINRFRLPGWGAAVALILVAAFLYAVRDVLPPFLLAVALAFIFSPLVGRLERFLRLSSTSATFAFYLIILIPLGGAALLWLMPPLVAEAQALADSFPAIMTHLFNQLFGKDEVQALEQTFKSSEVADYLIRTTWRFLGLEREGVPPQGIALGAAINTFLTLVLLAYLLSGRVRFAGAFLALVPGDKRDRWRTVIGEVGRALSPFVFVLVLQSILTFIATWLAFGAVYSLPYVLPISVASALLWLVPFIGPLAAGMLAAMVGLANGGLEQAVGVAVFYFLLLQLEHELVAKRIQGGLAYPHPIIAIFAALAGGALAGVAGALLAIPAAAAVKAGLTIWHTVPDGSEKDPVTYVEDVAVAGDLSADPS